MKSIGLGVLALLVVTAGAGPSRASSEVTGVVRRDEDGDGAASAGERGIANVAVSDGRIVVRTDSDGRYRLPGGGDDVLVQLTCPDDHICPAPFRRGSGDFAIRSAPAPDDFFFIQISDAHVYDEPADFSKFSSLPIPWWMPQIVADWLTLYVLEQRYSPGLTREDIVAALRDSIAPYREVEGLSDLEIYRAYTEEMARQEMPLSRIVDRLRESLAEVGGLGPDFIVSTGDLWLEGNTASPEAIERWSRLYLAETAKLPMRVINTIGNNEIAGYLNEDFPADHAIYGKGLWRRIYGPTAFSFDRGPFHFVAFDTHHAKGGDERDWDFYAMEPAISQWAAADLAAHPGRVVVALNHEPFHYDEAWNFDDPRVTDDAGLFAAHSVAYSLAGHTHLNGLKDVPGETTHITTGALSGMRWVLPPAVHPRGYRLFQARDGRLYSAWKPTGAPILGFVSPIGAASPHDLYPGSKEPANADALAGVVDVVVVAAAAAGPVTGLRLSLDDEPLTLQPWSPYFARARVDATLLPAGGATLTLYADGQPPVAMKVTPALTVQ